MGVDKLGKLLKDLGHLISTLAAADINDNVRIAPFCKLVLCHCLTRSESAGDSRCAALCNGQNCIYYPLSCDKGPCAGQPFLTWAWSPYRPPLAKGKLLLGPLWSFYFNDCIIYSILSVRSAPDHLTAL